MAAPKTVSVNTPPPAYGPAYYADLTPARTKDGRLVYLPPESLPSIATPVYCQYAEPPEPRRYYPETRRYALPPSPPSKSLAEIANEVGAVCLEGLIAVLTAPAQMLASCAPAPRPCPYCQSRPIAPGARVPAASVKCTCATPLSHNNHVHQTYW